MHRIIALVPFVTCKYIQVCAIQPDSVFLNLLEVSFHIVRSLCRTQIRLRSARPFLMFRDASVCETARVILIEAWRRKIIIPVLIVDSKYVATFMHCIHQRLHAFPSSCFFTCRQIIRVLVVISWLCPSVQMQVQLFHSEVM